MWWQALLGIVCGILLLYVVLLVLLWRASGTEAGWREAARLLPDLLRLLRRLAADNTLPRGVRIRVGLLLAYLASPIDLVPDFVPVLGYADDAVIAALVLRSVVRRAGPDAVRRHWPGTGEGLALIGRLAALPAAPGDTPGDR
ncbi:MAG: YkvA family protein [Sciscionella sp.]